jgi:hypothetical protein
MSYHQLTLDDLSSSSEQYTNFLGIKALADKGWGCFPVCPQHFNRKNAEQAKQKFAVNIPKGASCKEIDIEMQRIQTEKDMINGKIAAGDKGKYWTSALKVLEEKMADAKNRRNAAKCDEIKAKQEKEQSTKENIETLAKVTKDATTTDPESDLQAKIDEAKGAKPDYTKWIAIGIAGVFVLGAVILLLKPSKPAAVPAAV